MAAETRPKGRLFGASRRVEFVILHVITGPEEWEEHFPQDKLPRYLPKIQEQCLVCKVYGWLPSVFWRCSLGHHCCLSSCFQLLRSSVNLNCLFVFTVNFWCTKELVSYLSMLFIWHAQIHCRSAVGISGTSASKIWPREWRSQDLRPSIFVASESRRQIEIKKIHVKQLCLCFFFK